MECHRLISSVAHQKPVTFLLNSSAYTITASYDHSIRVFDQTNLQVSHTLHGHKAPVTSICLDSDDNVSTTLLFNYNNLSVTIQLL